jgi:hypothetical protein
VLALDTMVRENLFICARYFNPVRFEACSWRCSNTSCRYAEEPFPPARQSRSALFLLAQLDRPHPRVLPRSEVSITEADIIDYYQGGMSEIAARDRA